MFESVVLLRCQLQPKPSPSNRDAMLQRGSRFEVHIGPAALSQFDDFLLAGEGEFLAERGLQVRFKESDMPSLTLLE